MYILWDAKKMPKGLQSALQQREGKRKQPEAEEKVCPSPAGVSI